ncbi:MAG TPA: hypothetical protein VLF68_00125 [Candidatus Saccharimonadales bacterium]|nr:hypothetical protein [Candidatus Saccharimonadales bacterium]
MRFENRPGAQEVGCALKSIKTETGFTSNKAFGERIGASDAAASQYINGIRPPHMDAIGNVFALLEEAQIPDDKREELRERFTQAVVPHVIFAGQQEQHTTYNPLDTGAIRQRSFFRDREDHVAVLQNPQRRARVSGAKRIHPIADTPQAQQLNSLIGEGKRFSSAQDYVDAHGNISRMTVTNWLKGKGMKPEHRERLKEILQSVQNPA